MIATPKKLYKVLTTKSKTFFIVADDPTSAETAVIDWIHKHDWQDQSVSSIEVVAECDEYTNFSVLVSDGVNP